MTMLVTRTRGLGDILSDLENVASAVTSGLSPGGLQAWFQNQIAALNALPNDVKSLQAQIAAITAIVQANGNDSVATAALTAASNDVAAIVAQYPTVNANVGQAMVTVTPLLGSASSTILPLLANSPALVGAFDGLTTLIAMRDDARTQLQAITTDYNLTADVRAQISAAIVNNVSTPTSAASWLGWALVIGGGLLAFKIVRKVL